MSWLIYATVLALGLLAGSFLNVVIHRGPAMWGLSDDDRGARGTLAAPRSYCPACRSQIAIADLVPVASYFALRGKCRTCGGGISLRYPAVELAGAAAAMAALAAFGATWTALFAAAFLLALIALAAIDFETGYLPDAITLPLIALGLAANATGRFVSLSDALVGAAAGYAIFQAIAWAYYRMRGREGLGGGDAKLLAAIGAWGGWVLLAPTVFIASVAALAVVGAAGLAGQRFAGGTEIRFGPALCGGGAAMFLALGLGLLPTL